MNRIKPVWIELGLQTIHEETALRIRRGFPLSVFDDALRRLKQAGIYVIVHMIIGLPGETIESRGGVTYINGEPIDEGFLMPGNTRRYALIDFGPVEIPEDSYFVMGDNRDNSNDSRAVGCIKKSEMVGQAQFIWWPLNKIQGLRYSPEE